MEAERNDGINIAGSSMTYAEYYEQWVKDYKYGNLKPTTEHLYKHRINVIRDLFGSITLSQLSHAVLQKKIDEYGETRQKTTVNLIVITVKASLKDALYDGYIPRDIFSRVKPHSDLEPVNRIKALSATDFKKTTRLFICPLCRTWSEFSAPGFIGNGYASWRSSCFEL